MEAPSILHALPSQTVIGILSRRTANSAIHLGHYEIYLAGEDQQQNNQPNDLADC